MTHQILIGIVGVLVLGIASQWIAWRFRLPSILLLLLVGFAAGPVTGFLPSSSLEGDWLYAFVSISIGVILFEGGLSLRVSELREVGTSVLNLVTVGVLVTWALAALGAYYIVGFETGLAILTGAILTVTGPTVIVPLLRQVRPTGRVGAVAKWEGITIDPAGAMVAVLVLEAILLLNRSVEASGDTFESAVMHAVEGLLLTIATSVGISVIGSALLVFLLYRRLVPDYLQSAMALAIVVGTFGLSNSLQEESGLLEATLMGIIMANQKFVPVRRITEFKEDLQVLLIGSLFILLSARLELSSLEYMLQTGPLLFLAALIVVVRPVAVAISTVRSRLDWKEKAFLSWLAPRGIVAAAVSALFAFRLEGIYPQAGDLVPLVFLVIVGTVAVYGLSCSSVARWLGIAHPNPQGVVILGASRWVQRMALAVQELGFRVLLMDSNPDNVGRAKSRGLNALTADALSESTVDKLDLGGIGRFIAMTPNDEVNALASLNFAEIFESNEVYQLAARATTGSDRTSELPQHLRGHPLFGTDSSYASLSEQFELGGEIRTVELEEADAFTKLKEGYEDEVTLLFVARGDQLFVNSQEELMPQSGDRVVILVPSSASSETENQKEYERIVANALVIDLDREMAFRDLAEKASALFAQRLPVTAGQLVSGFMEGARFGAMPVADGVALPHYRLPDLSAPELLLVRCKQGLHIDVTDADAEQFSVDLSGPVYSMIFLVSPQDRPSQHLNILANLARRIDSNDFMERWHGARSEQDLKEVMLDPDRLMSVDVTEENETSFAGVEVGRVDLPGDAHVVMVGREGDIIVPSHDTLLVAGDRLSIAGDPSSIHLVHDDLDQ